MNTTAAPIGAPPASNDPLDVLVRLSRHYGGDPAFVIAGGGNTSVKVGDLLYVKASGVALAAIGREGFVEMDRRQLADLAATDLGDDPAMREARFKEAVFAARTHPEKNQRPSVEVLLHHMVPGRFVVHTHATAVNALTCCVEGEALARELFGDEVLWLPYVDPGFTLACTLAQGLARFQGRTGREAPTAILMANHGLIVAGDMAEQVRERTDWVLARVRARLAADARNEAFGSVTRADNARATINTVAPLLRGLLADETHDAPLKIVTFDDSDLALSLVGGEDGKAAAMGGPLTPDQIVYCNSFPIWVELTASDAPALILERLRSGIAAHTKTTGYPPKVILVRGVGLFAVGTDYAQANTTRQVYLDAVAVMAGATRLGRLSYLSPAHRRFIEEWQVEAYRKQVAARAGGQATRRGLAFGKVALVTGAAQGFGLEIARSFAAEGGYVVLGDVNEQGACAAATDICASHGPHRALGLAMDVTSVPGIAAAIDVVVRRFGGFDVLIANAGVLRAGSVKTQPEKDFDLVTAVNYRGYFLCVQHGAPILAAQHSARPQYRGDIIQINSKSGLTGSNKNGAYSGGKFGGIGLTESFALELIEDGIKVNAICPGNYFDGPLWSDPQNGLFVQYLRAGKVPGAKTVEDVRRFYEAKVPMGRGCTAADVMTAIFYLIDQQYETGQALPVTGGQVMLH